jgi:hypothetical protein
MKYYRIENSIHVNIIGTFPQIQDGEVPTTINHPLALSALLFEKATAETQVPRGRLDKKAKLTDLLSASFSGLSGRLVVSKRFKEILEGFSSEGVEFLKSSVLTSKGKTEDYWIVNPFQSGYNFLDFHDSEFSNMDGMGRNIIKNVNFASADDFILAYLENRKSAISNPFPNHRPLMITKIVIKPTNDRDFFSIAPIKPSGIGFFVSEVLKRKIEDEKISGIEFIEL